MTTSRPACIGSCKKSPHATPAAAAPEPEEKQTQTIEAAQEKKAATKDQNQFKRATHIGEREWKRQKVDEHQPPHKMCMRGDGGLTEEEREPPKHIGKAAAHGGCSLASKKWKKEVIKRYKDEMKAASEEADAMNEMEYKQAFAEDSGLGLRGLKAE